MKPSENLFSLIRSLSKTEKGYFKKFTSKHVLGEGNNYILLFDAINSQAVYNEKAIVKQFAGQPFIRQIHVYKNYLFKLILRSLRSFHEDRSSSAKMYELLRDASLLEERSLFSDAMKKLRSAEIIAEKYDAVYLHALILKKQVETGLSQLSQGVVGRGLIDTAHHKQRSLLAKASRQNDVLRNYATVLTRVAESGIYGVRKKIPAGRMKEIVKFLEQVKHPDDTFDSLKNLYWLGGFYHASHSRHEKAFLFRKKLLQLYENNPHQTAENLLSHINQMYNYVIVSLNLEKYDEVDNGLNMLEESLKKLPNNAKNYKYKIQLCIYESKVFYAYAVNKFERINGISKEIERTGLIENIDRCHQNGSGKMFLMNVAGLVYYTAVLYFYLGNYRKCIHWLNKLVNSDKKDLNGEFLHYASFMSMMAHYQLEEPDLLESLARSALRTAEKDKQDKKFENIFLKNMFLLSQTPSRKEQKNIFEKMRPEFKKLGKDKKTGVAFRYFDFNEWIESNLTGRTIAKVMNAAAD